MINVKDFGAIGDNVHDDTDAFVAAWNHANSKDGEQIYIPAGVYPLRKQLNIHNTNIVITGEGIGVTELRWSSQAQSEGLKFRQDSGRFFSQVKDLDLLTFKTHGNATAITVDCTVELANVDPSVLKRYPITRVLMENVNMGLADIDNRHKHGFSKGWNIGILLKNVGKSVIERCHFRGMGIADNLRSEAFLYIDSPEKETEYNVTNCWAALVKKAIKMTGDGEGLLVNNATFVGVNYGIHWVADNQAPQALIMGSHINAYKTCVHLSGVSQSQICNNLFFRRIDSYNNVGYGVRIMSNPNLNHITGQQNIVANNTIVNGQSPEFSMIGVSIEGLASHNSISNNIFTRCKIGVKWVAFRNNQVINNLYISCPTDEQEENS